MQTKTNIKLNKTNDNKEISISINDTIHPFCL